MAQYKEHFVIKKCLKIKWTGLAGNGIATIRRVRTEQPHLDQTLHMRLLNLGGIWWLAMRKGKSDIDILSLDNGNVPDYKIPVLVFEILK